MSANANNAAKSALKSGTAPAGNKSNAPKIDIAKVIDDAMKLSDGKGKATAQFAAYLINSVEWTYSALTKVDVGLAGAERSAAIMAILTVNSKHVADMVKQVEEMKEKKRDLDKQGGRAVQATALKYELEAIDGRVKSAKNVCETSLRVARLLMKRGAFNAEVTSKNLLRCSDGSGVASSDSMNGWLKAYRNEFNPKPDTSVQDKTSEGATASAAATGEGVAAAPAGAAGKSSLVVALHTASTTIDLIKSQPDKPSDEITAEMDLLVSKLLSFYGDKRLLGKIDALKLKATRDAKPAAK